MFAVKELRIRYVATVLIAAAGGALVLNYFSIALSLWRTSKPEAREKGPPLPRGDLAGLESAFADRDWEQRYFCVWKGGPWSSWNGLHTLVVDSLFVADPDADVSFILPSVGAVPAFGELPAPIARYREMGYRVRVQHISPAMLLESRWFVTPGNADWLREMNAPDGSAGGSKTKLPDWRFRFEHFAEYVSTFLLHRFGGIYMELDTLLLHRLPLGDIIALKHDPGSVHESSREYAAPGVVIKSQRGGDLLRRALDSAFSLTTYDPARADCIRANLVGQNVAFLPRNVLFPNTADQVAALFNNTADQVDPGLTLPRLVRRATGIHLFPFVTSDLRIVPGSSMHDLVYARSLMPGAANGSALAEDVPKSGVRRVCALASAGGEGTIVLPSEISALVGPLALHLLGCPLASPIAAAELSAAHGSVIVLMEQQSAEAHASAHERQDGSNGLRGVLHSRLPQSYTVSVDMRPGSLETAARASAPAASPIAVPADIIGGTAGRPRGLTLADVNRFLSAAVYRADGGQARHAEDVLTLRLLDAGGAELGAASMPLLIFPRLVTFISHTHGRPHLFQAMQASMQRFFPGTALIASDDAQAAPGPDAPAAAAGAAAAADAAMSSGAGLAAPIVQHLPNHTTLLRLPFDTGLSGARNTLVAAATTPYVFVWDDDFSLTPHSHMDLLLLLLHRPEALFASTWGGGRGADPDADAGGVAAGAAAGGAHRRAHVDIAGAVIPADISTFGNYRGLLLVEGDRLSLRRSSYDDGATPGCVHVDFVPNVFMARRSTLLMGWDPALKLGEHEELFLRAKKAGLIVASCDGVEVQHNQAEWWNPNAAGVTPQYASSRGRVYDYFRVALRKHGLRVLDSFGVIQATVDGGQ